MGARHALVLIVVAAAGLPALALAQSVTPGELDQAARRGEQLLRDQQLLEQERQRERERERQVPAGEALPAAPAEAAAPADDGKCVDVKRLELVGARLLPPDRVASFERDVVGHCVGVPELNALLRRITSTYVSLGYVTTRAYVPPQEAKDGRLTLVVVEGTIERIEVEPRRSATAATAFPGMVGRVFNLRDAEQGVDQLNRLGTNDARLDIRPGPAPGSSVLVILNQPRRRTTGSFASDNTGSAATGEWQGTFTASLDDLFDLNDGFYVTHTRSIDDPQGPAASRATSINYSVPYGWWTGSVSYSESSYDTVVQGLTRSFITSGTGDSATLRVERVAFRDQSRKLTVYAGLVRRDSENFVADQLIESSSRVITAMNLEANLSVVQGAALWSFDGGIARGVTWFGALDDESNLPAGAPRAQFLKYTAGTSVSRTFEKSGIRTQLSSRLSAQWTNDTLYSSEQIALAGPFSVRGYRDSRLYGDRGLTLRNEVAFPFVAGLGTRSPLGIRPFVGADFGKVWSHGETEGGSLSGWSAGVGLSYAPVSLQLSFSGAGPRSAAVPSDHMFFARFAAGF